MPDGPASGWMASCRISGSSSDTISAKISPNSVPRWQRKRRLASTSAFDWMESRMAYCSAASSAWATSYSAMATLAVGGAGSASPASSSSSSSSSGSASSMAASCFASTSAFASSSPDSGGRPIVIRASCHA
nr:putative protein TPRXL [Aegilops tauschii subsp. strangulata]